MTSNPFAAPKAKTVDVAGLSVFLGMPAHRDIPVQTVGALIDTQRECQAHGVSLSVEFKAGCSLVEIARSMLVKSFLESRCERLFWVDSDIVWRGRDFIKLLALSGERPVVGAAYPAKRDPLAFLLDAEEPVHADDQGCIAIRGCGLGFMVMHRAVIEELAETSPRVLYQATGDMIPHMFRLDIEDDGNVRGEDMAFLADVRANGHRVMVDPTIELGHVGSKVYSARLADAMQEEADGE